MSRSSQKRKTQEALQSREERQARLREQQAPQGVLAYSETSSLHSGPLPDPETWARYDQILPGTAERLLAGYERQSAHRQKLESWSIIGGVIQSYVGTASATGVTIFVVYQCAQIVLAGYAVTGMVGIVSSLASLAGVFVYGRRKQAEELDEKSRQN